MMELNGRTQTLSQWCKEYSLSERLVWSRMEKLGWPFEKALTAPVRKITRRNGDLEFDGKTQSMSAWSRVTGLGLGTIRKRLSLGWSVFRTLTTKTKGTK